MTTPAVVFWALLILASIIWYGFLVFYVGLKAGREILELVRNLQKDPPPKP